MSLDDLYDGIKKSQWYKDIHPKVNLTLQLFGDGISKIKLENDWDTKITISKNILGQYELDYLAHGQYIFIQLVDYHDQHILDPILDFLRLLMKNRN